jgi:hypothetical protein
MVVIPYGRFGTAYRIPCSRFKKSVLNFCFLILEDVPMGYPETSIKNTTARYVMFQKKADIYFAVEA